MTKKSFKAIDPVKCLIAQPGGFNQMAEQMIEIKKDEPKELELSCVETKSRHAHFLIKPSIMDALSTHARVNQTSKNDLINKLLEEYLRERGYL